MKINVELRNEKRSGWMNLISNQVTEFEDAVESAASAPIGVASILSKIMRVGGGAVENICVWTKRFRRCRCSNHRFETPILISC